MIRAIKSIIRQNLEKRGYAKIQVYDSLASHPEALYKTSFTSILGEYLLYAPIHCFLQIGAYDGITGDPLHDLIKRLKWRGILIEPQYDIFQRLRKTYADQPQLILENIAINAQNGSRILYCLKDEYKELTRWSHRQFASFDPMHVVKHIDYHGNYEKVLNMTMVECLNIESLLKKHNINTIDLLQIDAEGYDYEILKSIDFTRVSPAIINFEYVHLSMTDRENCLRLLIDAGYRIHIGGMDITACHVRS